MSKVGIDIVKLDRLKDVSDSFVKKVLSLQEIEVYEKYSGSRKVEYLGGRFASKEAIIKCLSEVENPNMNEISVLNRENGRPYVVYKTYDIDISISHEKEYAIAMAILNNNDL